MSICMYTHIYTHIYVLRLSKSIPFLGIHFRERPTYVYSSNMYKDLTFRIVYNSERKVKISYIFVSM